VCGSTRVFSRVTPASVILLLVTTVHSTSPVPARSRKGNEMAKVEVETTVTLVMSLEEAFDLRNAIEEMPSEVCSEVYLALDDALPDKIF
jgi:hypothetical protein